MVFDSIKNAPLYYGLGEGIEKALKYFAQYDASSHENTMIEIDPEKIFIRRGTYTTAPSPNAQLEAHRDFIDVMMVAEGEEAFFCKPLAECLRITKEYDPQIEACLAEIEGDAARFRFPAGYFAIFMPSDAHCAGQCWSAPSNVKKLIAKVHVGTL